MAPGTGVPIGSSGVPFLDEPLAPLLVPFDPIFFLCVDCLPGF